MAATHGLLNSLTFVLPGLVGWLVTWSSSEHVVRPSLTRFSKAAAVWFLQD
jgi:hypothetical protein